MQYKNGSMLVSCGGIRTEFNGVHIDPTWEPHRYLDICGRVESVPVGRGRSVVRHRHIGEPFPRTFCGHERVMGYLRDIEARYHSLPNLENASVGQMDMYNRMSSGAMDGWLEGRARAGRIRGQHVKGVMDRRGPYGFEGEEMFVHGVDRQGLQVGDRVYFHYQATGFAKREYKDGDGGLRTVMDFANKVGKGLFLVWYRDLFCFVRDGRIVMLNGNVLVSPSKGVGWEKKGALYVNGGRKVNTGVLACGYGGPGLEGREVWYADHNDFMNVIEGVEYAVMKEWDLVAFRDGDRWEALDDWCLLQPLDFTVGYATVGASYLRKDEVRFDTCYRALSVGQSSGLGVGDKVVITTKRNKRPSTFHFLEEDGHEWFCVKDDGQGFRSRVSLGSGIVAVREGDIIYKL